MPQPATLIARTKASIAVSRPHSRAPIVARTARRRCLAAVMRTALPPRTGARWADQARRPDSLRKEHDRCGTVPDSHRTSLGWLPSRPSRPGLWETYKARADTVKAHQMIRYRRAGLAAVSCP